MFDTRGIVLLIVSALVYKTSAYIILPPGLADLGGPCNTIDCLAATFVGPASAGANYPIINVQVDGNSVSAPQMDDKRFNEARLKMDRGIMENSMNTLQKLGHDIIKRKKSMLLQGPKAVVQLGLMVRSYKNKQKELDKIDPNIKYDPIFSKRMAAMIFKLLRSKSNEHLDRDEANKRFQLITESARQVVLASDTGVYMDWEELRINGVPLLDYVAPIIQWFHDKGYSNVIKSAESLSSILLKYSTDDEHKTKSKGLVANMPRLG